MKTFNYELDDFQMARMTSAIRTKKDVIILWMQAIKTMASYVPPPPQKASARMALHVGKMSRLFFSQNSKIFTVNFPFSIREQDEKISFRCPSCVDLDSRVTSEVISLIATKSILEIDDFSSFCDPVIEATNFDTSIWSLVRDLCLTEEGYLRFDHDPNRADGAKHPLNHLDIFYSSGATFKIGTQTTLTISELRDIVDIGVDCHFINKPSVFR